jgi:DNA-binding NarL/FixJ family response regulator
MVSNHYKPFEFDDKGKMWLAICSTTLSTKNHRIESYIEIMGKEERYVFSPTKKEFIKSKSLKLSTKEHQILILSSQGYTSKEIAEKMAISLNTIKFHKQNILVKLNVQNISEACLYAFAHNLF